MKRPFLAGDRGQDDRARTGCQILMAIALLALLIDWGCSLQQVVDIDASGNSIRLKSVKVYLDRAPGLGEPER